MAKKEKKQEQPEAVETEVTQETAETPEVNPWEENYNAEHDSYLRLAADYDNFRKRTAKEKDQSYTNGKSDAVEKLLKVVQEEE